MFKFFLKTVLLGSILFIGLIIGYLEANNGMQKMKGYDDGTIEEVLTVNYENGEYETTILGQTVSSHDLEEKQKVLEEYNTYNFFTDLAKKFTDFLTNLLSYIIP